MFIILFRGLCESRKTTGSIDRQRFDTIRSHVMLRNACLLACQLIQQETIVGCVERRRRVGLRLRLLILSTATRRRGHGRRGRCGRLGMTQREQVSSTLLLLMMLQVFHVLHRQRGRDRTRRIRVIAADTAATPTTVVAHVV